MELVSHEPTGLLRECASAAEPGYCSGRAQTWRPVQSPLKRGGADLYQRQRSQRATAQRMRTPKPCTTYSLSLILVSQTAMLQALCSHVSASAIVKTKMSHVRTLGTRMLATPPSMHVPWHARQCWQEEATSVDNNLDDLLVHRWTLTQNGRGEGQDSQSEITMQRAQDCLHVPPASQLIASTQKCRLSPW